MFLEGILAISGQSGLFKKTSQGKNSVIVESLLTGKKMPTFVTSKVSALIDVAIYTDDNEVPLVEVFLGIFEICEGKEAISSKSSKKELEELFEKVLPTYDKDRVYTSDIKKVISWYNLLVDKEVITAESVEKTKAEMKEIEEKEKNAEN